MAICDYVAVAQAQQSVCLSVQRKCHTVQQAVSVLHYPVLSSSRFYRVVSSNGPQQHNNFFLPHRDRSVSSSMYIMNEHSTVVVKSWLWTAVSKSTSERSVYSWFTFSILCMSYYIHSSRIWTENEACVQSHTVP